MFDGETAVLNKKLTQHPSRLPTATEERIAGFYRCGYRHDFNDPMYQNRIEDYLIAWGHELVGQKANKEMFRVAQVSTALGVQIGLAIGQKKGFDELMQALRERFPHYNLNFSL